MWLERPEASGPEGAAGRWQAGLSDRVPRNRAAQPTNSSRCGRAGLESHQSHPGCASAADQCSRVPPPPPLCHQGCHAACHERASRYLQWGAAVNSQRGSAFSYWWQRREEQHEQKQREQAPCQYTIVRTIAKTLVAERDAIRVILCGQCHT